ncbi:unnamed protein product [Gordionus sp. m RMFG-2023]
MEVTHPYIEMVEGRENLEIRCSLNSFPDNVSTMADENHRLYHIASLKGRLTSSDASNNYLIIDRVDRRHSGLILCVSTGYLVPCRMQFYFFVLHEPTILPFKSIQSPKIGNWVELECNHEANPRPFEVVWIYRASGFVMISMQEKLVIKEFAHYHYGDYACIISNRFYDHDQNLQIKTESTSIRLIPSLDTECDPPEFDNGYIILKDYWHELEAEFYCNMFYRLEGCKSTICGKDNVWSDVPKCVLVYGMEEINIMLFFLVLAFSLLVMYLFNVYVWYKDKNVQAYEKARLLDMKILKLDHWKKIHSAKPMDERKTTSSDYYQVTKTNQVKNDYQVMNDYESYEYLN